MAEINMSARVGRYLAGLARRLKDDPIYMAYVLKVYQKQEHLHDDALAEYLNISTLMLTRLALCKRPVADSTLFADEVRQIAIYVSADPAILAHIIRQVHILEKLAMRPEPPQTEQPNIGWLPAEAGLLAAARDRGEVDDEENPDEQEASDEDI
jgi:hypothetical protein